VRLVNLVIYLIPVFVVLTAGWILLAWSVAEHHNLKWLRILCARLFVGIVFCVGVGAGVVGTRYHLRKDHRQQLLEFATGLRDTLHTENSEQVLELLDTVIEAPDEWSNGSSDILERTAAVVENMQPGEVQAESTEATEIAERPEIDPIQPVRR